MSGQEEREYGAFIPECNKRGISKSVAYQLLSDELLDTFTIGRRRYVYLDSLRSLPKRLQRRQAGVV